MSSIRFLYWEIFVLLVIVIYIDVAWTEGSDLEGETKCQLRTLSCSCDAFYNNSDSGFKVNVTYRDCDDGGALNCQNCDYKESICGAKKIYFECRKAFVALLKRKRREMSTDSYNRTTEMPGSSLLPSVTIQPKSRSVLPDGDVTFECIVYSNSAANITWLFNGVLLSKQGKTLTLKSVDVTETGNYTCVVENEYGKTSASASLNVFRRDGPQIIGVELEGEADKAYLRSNINITCKSYNSDNNIFIKNSNRALREKGKYTYYHWREGTTLVTSLEIQNITMEDAGNYTCFAVGIGLSKSRIYLLKVAACPPGFYCPLPDNKAMPCEPGTYRNASDNITSHCNNCLPGHYCPRESVEPVHCHWGTYMPFKNASSQHDCIPCPNMVTSGKDTTAEPAVSREDCPAGKINVTDQVPKDERASAPDFLSTPEIVGAIAGTVGALVIIVFVSLYCTVKRTCCLSSWLNKASSNCQDLGFFGGGTVSSCNGQLLQTIESNVDHNTANSEVVKVPVEPEYETLYDVFICYSSKDTSWVKKLVAELESRNFRCCIDFRDFVPGAAILQNISEAIYCSRKTIAVLSPDFVESEWCSHELQKALTRIRFHQVVPIVYRNCEIPLVLRDRTYLDWENCYVKPYFWEQLEKAVNRSNDNGVL